jgi:hypothetical protein
VTSLNCPAHSIVASQTPPLGARPRARRRRMKPDDGLLISRIARLAGRPARTANLGASRESTECCRQAAGQLPSRQRPRHRPEDPLAWERRPSSDQERSNTTMNFTERDSRTSVSDEQLHAGTAQARQMDEHQHRALLISTQPKATSRDGQRRLARGGRVASLSLIGTRGRDRCKVRGLLHRVLD